MDHTYYMDHKIVVHGVVVVVVVHGVVVVVHGVVVVI